MYFFTIFCMVSFCLGLDKVMSEGNLLYFLRKPFEGLYEDIESMETRYKAFGSSMEKDEQAEIEARIFKQKLLFYITKPFFTCLTCFASVWGGSVFITLNGWSHPALLIIACISTAYIQTAIYVKVNI